MTKHQKIRVLHVISEMRRAGVETWLTHILRHMDRTQYQMDFCCLSGKPGAYASEIASLGGQIVLPPSEVVVGSLPHLPAFSRWFMELLKSGRYDAVHSHVLYFSGYILWLAQQANVPIRIAHAHNTRDRVVSSPYRKLYHRLMSNFVTRYATAGIAVSKLVAEVFFGPQWTADSRWKVMYLGLDFTAFKQSFDSRLRRELGIGQTTPVIGHVGRFSYQKNHGFLLDVFEVLLTWQPDAKLLLVGDGELRFSIEDAAQRRDLSNRIVFAGFRGDVPALMLNAMDIFVLPSLYEGLGLVVVEAQAAGLRCVVSDSDQVSQESGVVEGAVEFLPLSAGPEAWAKRVLVALERGRLEQKSALAQVCSSRFSLDKNIEELKALYIKGKWREISTDNRFHGAAGDL